MILFSVIIPHYNSVFYLEKLIKTIPEKDSIQVIVVDDKSTEDVSEIKKMVSARKGIFVHNSTEKKGAGTCRNLGMREAKGKWLVFADADDFFLPDAFCQLERYVASEEDIIYFPPTSVYRDTDRLAKRHWHNYSLVSNYYKHPTRKNELLLRYKYKVPWSKMVRRELVEKYGILYDEVPAANDVMFSIKCAYYARSIGVSKQQIYCVTSAEGTLETAHNEKNFWSGVEVHKARCQFLQEKLSEKDYNTLGLGGLPFILSAVRKGYSFKFIRKIFVFLRKNHLKICTINEIKDVVSKYWMIFRENFRLM